MGWMTFSKADTQEGTRLPLSQAIWLAARRDLLLGLPWIPLYSVAELGLGAVLTVLLQLIFVDTPRVAVSHLIPDVLRSWLPFGQTIDRKDLAVVLPGLIVILGLLKLICNFLSTYLVERAGHGVAHSLRQRMLSGYLLSPGNLLDRKNPDEVANQILVDTTILQGAMSRGFLSAVRDAIVVLGALLSILLLAMKTVLVAVAVIVPLVLVIGRISKVFNDFSREAAARQVGLSTRALQTRHGLLTVAGLRTRWRELQDFRVLAWGYHAFASRTFFVRMFFRPGMEFAAVSLLAAALWWRFRLGSSFEAATWSGLFVFVAILFRPLKNIANFVAQFSEVRAVYLRIRKQWLAFNETRSGLPVVSEAPFPWALRASDVRYLSTAGDEILRGCTLSVERGRRVAFVGRSGSGKTTFLRVVAGLLSPSAGKVELDPRFLLATQMPYAFKGEVSENIIYNDSSRSAEVAISRVHELLLALGLAHSPGGAGIFARKRAGFLGEGLSGGERARVALGRVLYASPRLLLLDEPTANLDARSSALFWQAVDVWLAQDKENTLVAVLHVIDNPARWDDCFLFSEGRVERRMSATEALTVLQREE